MTDLLPLTDGIRLRTARVRVVIRPSGTEPKLKCYLQLTTPVPAGADLVPSCARLRTPRWSALSTEIAESVGLSG